MSKSKESLNRENKNNEDMNGNMRYNLGSLDLVSAIIIVFGIYLTQLGNNQIGGLLIVLGILKQFSGK